MSKADIENVCTLAAHLVMHPHTPGNYPNAAKATHDAMRLQRLGLRALRRAEKWCNVPDYEPEPEGERIAKLAAEILAPYGLTAQVTGDPRGYCLKIMGLPGNTWGGDESGFGI